MIHINTDRYDIALNLPSCKEWCIYLESGSVWLKSSTEKNARILGYSHCPVLSRLPMLAVLASGLGIKTLLVDKDNCEAMLTELRYRHDRQLHNYLENLNINS